MFTRIAVFRLNQGQRNQNTKYTHSDLPLALSFESVCSEFDVVADCEFGSIQVYDPPCFIISKL